MKIAFVEIQNFRKLKACRIDIGEQETIFVGANNSGKTSAMDALTLFLNPSRRKAIAPTDFTLSNWSELNRLGEQWVDTDDNEEVDLDIDELLGLLPAVDVWLTATKADLHRITHLLPTLDWRHDNLLGVRFVLAPKDVEQLYRDFSSAYEVARNAQAEAGNEDPRLTLWPSSMRDFLDRHLHSQFEVQYYILDPSACQKPVNGLAKPQELADNTEPLRKDPFAGLIKIDVISAQRGFSDPKTEDGSRAGFASLSTQLRSYFAKHLNPSEAPDARDVKTLSAIEEAVAVFNESMKTSFRPSLEELETLNYPGLGDPRISVTSKLDPRDTLDHEAAVQFELPGTNSLSLPEKYNGLGYQNLISMVFNLIRFRDEWMRVGKAARGLDSEDGAIEILHVVLIEEPEAHLHAQVQQVFIRKAYQVLRNNPELEDPDLFSTQVVVSTHSSHIAHELDFSCLRYFRREPVRGARDIPIATVISLAETFGGGDKTSKFATRYLRTTHCDLFFADAAILVEGAAERMLLPHFIREHFRILDQSYISLLEIGGSHAHRLGPLLDTLGLVSLIITDIDSVPEDAQNKVRPERDKDYITRNRTLVDWVPRVSSLDDLYELEEKRKETSSGLVRVAYQYPITLEYRDGTDEEEAIPYTFEDALALTNLSLFRSLRDARGLLKKLGDAVQLGTLDEAASAMFNDLETGSKAQMALELLYLEEPTRVEPPAYIRDGLTWLTEALEAKRHSVTGSDVASG